MGELILTYLLVGLGYVVVGIFRGVHTLEKHEVRYLGTTEVVETRAVPEFIVGIVLTLLFWPAHLIFWLVYVPVHDHFAMKAWERNKPPWAT